MDCETIKKTKYYKMKLINNSGETMINLIKLSIIKSHSFLRRVYRFMLRLLSRNTMSNLNSSPVYTPIDEESHKYRVETYRASKGKSNKVAFYTAITGNYEGIKVPEYFDAEVDYFVFTDNKDLEVYEPFRKIILDKFESDPTRLARWVKTNPHKILADYDVVIWVDSNILVKNSLISYVKTIQNSDMDIGMFKHPQRDSFSEEVTACLSLNKDSSDDIYFQMGQYKDLGLLDEINKQVLIETNVFIANLKNTKVHKLFDDWSSEIFRYSRRDQLALPHVLNKNSDLKLHFIENPNDKELIPRFNKTLFEIFIHSENIDYKLPEYLNQVDGEPFKIDIEKNNDESLSIVVPIYNAPVEVSKLLKTIESQSDNDFQLVLVDDDSEIETKNILNEYKSKYPETDLLTHEINKGYTTTVNDGVMQSKKDLIVVLNSDTELPKNFVARVKSYAKAYPDISAFGPITNAGSWQNVPNLRDQDGKLAINALPDGMDVDAFNNWLQDNIGTNIIKVNLLNGFCYVARRKVYDEVGHLDVTTFPTGYGEEDDFFIRTNLKGHQIAVMEDLYVFHHKTKSFTSEQKQAYSKAGIKKLHKMYSKNLVHRLIKNSSENPRFDELRAKISQELY